MPLYAADTFTATVPAGTETTMQDPNSLLPITITNNSSGRSISEIEIKGFTSQYDFSQFTVAPAGWCIDKVEDDKIKFKLTQPNGDCKKNTTGSEIPPGGTLLFNIRIIPVAAAADVFGDTLDEIKIKEDDKIKITGSLPTWTRRSFETTMVASPDSVGVGDEVTLIMQVINRSTATHSSITSTPAPPTASSAIVTNTGGPYYGSTLLNGDHTAASTTITVDSTTGFPAIGSIKIGSEEICYTGTTATTLTGITRGCNLTTAATHLDNSLTYDLTPFSLAAGATGTVTWTYSADSTGTVYFTARATSGSGTAKSISTSSNTVIIGDFTALLTVTPVYSLTGKSVAVQMDVKNNGSSTLINVAPSSLTGCAGGATESLVSGPSPSLVSSLAPGASTVFNWTYQVTGSIGDLYCMSGYATADGAATTNTDTSNTGTISEYTVTLSPSVIPSGSTNQAFNWLVYNGSGCTVDEVRIETPENGGDWNCSSVSPPSGWSASCQDKVKFKSGGNPNNIPSGGSNLFGITFSTTETVTVDTTVEFPVRLRCGGEKVYLSSFLTLTLDSVTLTHSPVGPIFADGTSTYTMTATLTSGGTPLSGKTVTFSITDGTLSSTTAVTDSLGAATVILTAPSSSVDTTVDVTATYFTATATDTVSFTGWNKPNIQYWGSLMPTTVNCGASAAFTMSVRNVHPTLSMNLDALTYFSFNDSSAGGGATYVANLTTPTTIPANTTVTNLQFNAVAVDSSFLVGSYTPAANSTPPPESGLFFSDGGTNDQYRSVTDTVTVGGSCGASTVDVIEWHEMR